MSSGRHCLHGNAGYQGTVSKCTAVSGIGRLGDLVGLALAGELLAPAPEPPPAAAAQAQVTVRH